MKTLVLLFIFSFVFQVNPVSGQSRNEKTETTARGVAGVNNNFSPVLTEQSQLDAHDCNLSKDLFYVWETAPESKPACDEVFIKIDRVSEHLKSPYLDMDSEQDNGLNKLGAEATVVVINNGNQGNNNSRISSMDGKFSCDSSGKYNQDFGVCEQVLSAYNVSLDAEPAILAEIGNKRQRNKTQLQQQMEFDQRSGNIQKKTFDYQIQELEMEKNIQGTLMGFYGAQITALEVYVETSWPTKEKLKNACEAELNLEEVCSEFIDGYKRHIIRNSAARTGFRLHAVGLLGKLNRHRTEKKVLQDRINMLRAYKEQVFAQDGTISESGFAAFCQTNPTHASCKLGSGRPDIASFGDGASGINFNSGTGSGLSFGDVGSGMGDVANSDSSDDELKDGLDQIFGEEATSLDESVTDAPSAARVEEGGGLSGGGAGGGGSGGGASAPGITPEDEAGTGKKQKEDLKVASFNPYAGKKKRGITIYGGGSRKKASKYNPKGALSSLSRKEKNRAIASRDIADKEIGLFKKISGRYARVKVDNRIAAPEITDGKSKK